MEKLKDDEFCLELYVSLLINFIVLLNYYLSFGLPYFAVSVLIQISSSKQNNYDEVVESLARYLGMEDPSKIRLTPHNCYSQQPQPQPIEYRGMDRLTDMLVQYNQVV